MQLRCREKTDCVISCGDPVKGLFQRAAIGWNLTTAIYLWLKMERLYDDDSWLKEADTREFESIVRDNCGLNDFSSPFEEAISTELDDEQPLYNYAIGSEWSDVFSPCKAQESMKGLQEKRKPSYARCLKHIQDYSLQCFRRMKALSQYPKKEYVRIWAIRKHNKMVKSLLVQKTKQKLLKVFEEIGEDIATAFKKFARTCELFRLKPSPLLTRAPGRRPRRWPRAKGQHRSYNDDFCRDYFGVRGVLESYRDFIGFFFMQSTKTLSNEMKIVCCEGGDHVSCVEDWLTMSRYLQIDILEEIGITSVIN